MENLQTDLTLKTEINLYYDLFVPDNAEKTAPLLIAVHGYGAHKRYMMREAKLVTPNDWAIASIQAPHQHFRKTDEGYRVGFGWLTDYKSEEYVQLHHDFILRIIDKLADNKTIDPTRVFLYGFSQACALNFRFAFTHTDILAGLIGVCGGIPGDLDTNNNYKPFNTQTLYLYGDNDEFYTQEQFASFNTKLKKILPNLTAKQYNAKHEIIDEMRTEIREFLKK